MGTLGIWALAMKTNKGTKGRHAGPPLDTTARRHEYVFGYGSLMHDWLSEEYLVANITGYRRDWEATMDNATDIAGYKYYVDESGSRDKIRYVSFLNVSRQITPYGTVTGLLKKVCPAQLSGLDARERNYVRIDVTQAVAVIGRAKGQRPAPRRIWTYTASDAARKRTRAMREGKHRQTVPASYYRAFKDAANALRAEQSTDMRLWFGIDKPDHLADLTKITIAQ